ncbi:MAG: Cell wall surface anchored protein [Candidatus Azambacteria bacterium GW2011_GWE1_42_9]|nr:MAG: Cell wall surface anchored protein [Candidatus Azambacteria bacterium GW2011_GWF1_41_10]KKS49276.1 MAG: Cell wall surface anchored protein [Candidatus Azambacteria bacterium GW2011_GWF2_42_22]KKS69495.1 MAG: Cell wall surface anchored protein [Candidatus Azambacteria bacterium GW2011_GWA2_42_62]KKS79370.1 MAG: Cell wall surface anchored protein [Candidatus Azambacteria bacterium GW2011_GWE1_42_9]KKT03144.1 MAG: Cell wall surface anchored protein [Candidatus Azambacteria bacterium GW2011
MFISKRESLPIGLIAVGVAMALVLSLSLVVPKAGAVTIEELLAQIQALQAQLTTLQGSSSSGTATACTFTRSLFLGVRDAQVKCLQQYLNGAGYTVAASGAGSVGSETTFFGPATKAAVAKWQAANAVSPAAGYFGAISRAKYSAVASVPGTPGIPGTPAPVPAAGGLSVGLSVTTPASRSIVVGAANMPFGKWTFTAGSGAVTVNTLKFTRSGISADAEVSNAELYDVATGEYIAQYTGLGSGVLTFANSGGLFTVNAGQSKEVELRLKNSGSNNHTMVWSLNAAADVTSNATSVAGTFPMASNAMTFVSVSDPAIATLTSTAVTTGSTVNAGTMGYLAGSFTLQAANSAVLLDRIVLTQNGSIISGTDVTNIKLVTTGGTQIGSTLPNLKADGTGTFVMSPAYEIPSGQTIQVNVYADVVAGVNRTLIFNVLNLRDIQAKDKTYSVGITPSASVTMTTITVGAGTLTLTLDSSSPTGNLAPGQTNVTVAKFKVVAYGEQIKVLYIPFRIYMTPTATVLKDFTDEIDNIYLVDDAGNQIGTTITAPSAATDANGYWDDAETTDPDATFGTSSSNINYLIPANTTRIWSLKMDILSTADGTGLTANLQAGTNNYQGQISNVSTGDTSAVTANALTIASNPFTAVINSSLGVGNLTKDQQKAKIGSFMLSASSAEGINVSTITVLSSTTFPFANLFVKVNGVDFGSVTPSPAAATNHTFAGTSPVNIPIGGNVAVDVYADVLSEATNLGSAVYVKLYNASAVGATTATSQTLYGTADSAAVSTTNISGQRFTVNITGGTLTIAKDSSSPPAYQVVMGKTNQTLAIWRLTGDTVSDKSITDITVTASTSLPSINSSFSNLQFYKGGVAVTGSTAPAVASGTTGWTYTFSFANAPIVVPENGIALELRGDVASSASGGSTSNGQYIFRIESPDDVTALSSSGSLSVTVSGPNGNTGTDVNKITVLKTKLTVTSDATGILTSGHAADSNDTVAVFVFTADPAASITINTVGIKMAGATLATLTFKLIDADTNTAWGSTISAGLALGLSTTNGTPTYGTTTALFNPAFSLSAGATKRVKVQADTTGLTATTGSTNGTLLQISLNDVTSGRASVSDGTNQAMMACAAESGLAVNTCNAIGWNDGTTGSLNLEAKVLPISGPSIRY